MKKIILLVPYFGSLPNYFEYWLKSVEKNPTIDFHLFVDKPFSHNVPPNVKVTICEFLELKQRFVDLFDFPISLEQPYKICDFRPAFGLAFENEVDGYDYWGHCDLDMVFGDIRGYLDRHLTNQIRFQTRGHFTLYENSSRANNLFRLENLSTSVDYVEAFSNKKGFSFDEWGGISAILESHDIKQFSKILYADIDISKYNFHIHYKKNYSKQIFLFEEGKLFRLYFEDGEVHKDEFMYIHLQKRHMYVYRSPDDRFYIFPSELINSSCFLNDKAAINCRLNKSMALKFYISFLKFKLKRIKLKLFSN